ETADGQPADDVRVSPDGAWALARVATQLYVMALPRTGAEPPIVNVFTPSVPVKRVTDIGADYFDWADGGRTITWAVGASFFRQPVSSISFEEEKEKEKGKKKDDKKGKKPLYQEVTVDLKAPRHKPHGTVVLRGARVVPMRDASVLENAEIV